MRQSANRTACEVDLLGDQHLHSAEDDLRVMIEVVVRDQHHFTRYFVSPVMDTPSHTLRSDFPYQPLFEAPREILHERNSIERRPIEHFSSSPSLKFKTQQVNIFPSLVETVDVPSASVLDAQFAVHEVVTEERTSSSAAETPGLPTEKILILSSPATETVPILNIETTTVQDLVDFEEVLEAHQIETAPTTSQPEVLENYSGVENIEEIATFSAETQTEPFPTEMTAENTENTTIESFTIKEENITQTTDSTRIGENEIITTTEAELTTEETQEFTSTPMPSPIVSTSESVTDQETTTVQIIAKIKKIKKKKPKIKKKKKKSPLVSNNLQMINQILQTFGLENHQGDAKQFDLIDFDEINQKQAAVATPKPQLALELPVLKKAPANASAERDCYYLRSKIKSRTHFYRDEKNCTKCSCKVRLLHFRN